MPATREDRNAALKARRETWTVTAEETCKVGDLKPGDFVIRLGGGHGLAPIKINSAVKTVTPTWNTWKLGRHFIQSNIIEFATVAGYDRPVDFNVVRRPA